MEEKEMNASIEVIGFDLGHAETAVTKTMMAATTDPRVLKILGQAPIITAIAEGPGTGILIGEEAYNNRNPEGLRVAFKSPNLKNPEIRHPIKLFVQRIVEILSEGRHIKGGVESLFVVGHPSGWDEAVRSAYQVLLQEAGMQQVRVLAESHAAFLAARDSLEVPAEALEGSVLIIDMGSSTTDFTAVVGRKEERKDFGSNELGAGIIDRIIFKRWLNTQKDSDGLFRLLEKYPQYESTGLLHARKVKEEHFNSSQKYADITKRMTVGDKRIFFDVEISEDDMDEILSIPIGEFLEQPNSELSRLDWKGAFLKILQDAQKVMSDTPPQMILLTGGASRMSFVVEYCEKVFPNARVERGDEPQFTIARGLAWAGRQDNKSEKFIKDIEEVCESGKLRAVLSTRPDDETPSVLDDLIGAIAEFTVYEVSENVIFPAFVEWREGRISTLNRLESAIQGRTEQFFKDLTGPNAEKLEKEVVAVWLDEYVKPTIEKQVEPICKKAGIPSSELRLSPDFDVALPHVRDIASPASEEALDSIDTMGTMTAVIGSIIIATLLGGGGTALLMSGPIGWIIGLAIGAGAMFLGKEVAMDMVKDADIPVLARKMMTSEEAVQEKLEDEENQQEFFGQIFEALQKNASAFDELLDGIVQAVKKDLAERAKEAALLIK